MTWLITGGAGYIGAHVARSMVRAGESVVVYDDLSSGIPERLPDPIPLVIGSTLDRAALDSVISAHRVTGVVHLAAKKQVGESVEKPLLYYRENMQGLQTLLEAAAAADVDRFVFSSSAAVYGTPDVELVTESTPCAPLSPYGETKLAGEWLVRAVGRAHGMSTTCLRYFNVAGAEAPELADTGVSNVIPMFFEKLTAGQAPMIFGDDYPTADGTCVRDYVHIADLASAHTLAARRPSGEGGLTLNVGTGLGVSVRELADLVAEVSGCHVPPVVVARRPGDPARVVASSDLITEELGWSARYDVRDMVVSAWEGWCLRHPEARRS